MKKVLLITKSNASQGIGHTTRSKAIYKELRKFYLTKMITKEDKKHYSKYDILIFDLPSYKDFLKNYDYRDQKIVCLDYDGKYPIDLNFSSIKTSRYAKKNSVTIDNIIIDTQRSNISKKDNFILLTMGGSDPKNYTKKILLKILKNNFTKIKVVLGSLNNNFKTFKNINKKNITILKNPKNYKLLQSTCTYAITNGGMTMCEMIYIKKNIFAVPKNQNEKNFCKLVSKKYNLKFGSIKDIKFLNYKYKSKLKIGNKALLKEIKLLN